jgi:hypothetical protein
MMYCSAGSAHLRAHPELLLDVCVTAHPSNMRAPQDFQALTQPPCIIFPEREFLLTEEGISQVQEVLAEKSRALPILSLRWHRPRVCRAGE